MWWIKKGSVVWSPQILQTYFRVDPKGSSHQAAVRSLAFKWIRILYRCWQDRTPYDESKYLKALRRSGSPLLKLLTDAA